MVHTRFRWILFGRCNVVYVFASLPIAAASRPFWITPLCTGGLLSERSVDVRLTGRGDMQRSAGRDKDSRVGLSTGLTDWRINLQYARRAGLLARCASLHCECTRLHAEGFDVAGSSRD